MKKFLLLVVAVIATVSVSATERVKKAPLPKEKKIALTSQSTFGGTVVKLSDYQQLRTVKPVRKGIKAVKKTEEEPLTLIPAYSEWTYHYTSVAGGFLTQIMYDEASFLVTDDGKAYLRPFANLGVVEGEVVEGVEHRFSGMEEDYGKVDSITFRCDSVFAVYTDSTGVETDLFLEPCDLDEDYTPFRKGEKTFGGYYFADYEELYIPTSVVLALFEADESKTEIFTDGYVACLLDLLPKETLNEYISKGTFTAKSYYNEAYDYSGDAQIYLGEGFFSIKGIDGINEDAWVMFELDEDDESIATVFENQYMGTYNFYNDATLTDTHLGDVVTVGLLQEDGELTAFNVAEDYASTYKVVDNADDETTIITNTANTVYGDYIYAEEGFSGGMYEAVDLNIIITYEPVDFDVDGITSVKNSPRQGNAIYNMAGQRVEANYKGIVVKNGKKMLQK